MDGVSPLCGYAAVEAVLWIGEWHCPVQKTAWYKQHTKYCVSCLYQHNEKNDDCSLGFHIGSVYMPNQQPCCHLYNHHRKKIKKNYAVCNKQR